MKKKKIINKFEKSTLAQGVVFTLAFGFVCWLADGTPFWQATLVIPTLLGILVITGLVLAALAGLIKTVEKVIPDFAEKIETFMEYAFKTSVIIMIGAAIAHGFMAKFVISEAVLNVVSQTIAISFILSMICGAILFAACEASDF